MFWNVCFTPFHPISFTPCHPLQEEAQSELEDLALMRDLGYGQDLEVWDPRETSRRLGTGAYFGAIKFPQVWGVGRGNHFMAVFMLGILPSSSAP